MSRSTPSLGMLHSQRTLTMEYVSGLVLVGLLLFQAGLFISGSPEIESGCSATTAAFTSLGNLGANRYYYSATPLSWTQANRTCRSYKDTYIATIPDVKTKNFIVEKAGLLNRVWFGAQEVKFDRWTWVNDQVFYGEMKVYVTHNKNTCGFVNPSERDHLGQSPCYVNKRFLCANPAADPNNLRLGDYYISNDLERVTWFRAREACLCRGLDLVVAKGNFTDFIYELLEGDTDPFWIGLQKTRYVWERTGEAMIYLHFEKNQPNNYASKQDCLDLHIDLFSDNDCAAKLPFICVWENTTVEADRQIQAQLLGVQSEGGTAAVGVTAGLGWVMMAVVLVILIAVVIFGVLKTRAGQGNKQWLRFDNREDVSA